ncbi:hypothetical protein BC832DRAFT_592954 [Gaertneriomyces semiglobifer]|nr:hypothetical protein BC832DRAFT_592954 [Gaertneriomyces semiglobifer]
MSDQMAAWKVASSAYFTNALEPEPCQWLKHVASNIGLAVLKQVVVEVWWCRWVSELKDWKECEDKNKAERLRRVGVVKKHAGKQSKEFTVTFEDLNFDGKLEANSRDLALLGVTLASNEAERRHVERKRKEPLTEDVAHNVFLDTRGGLMTEDVGMISEVGDITGEDEADPKQWMARYRIVFLVADGQPFLGKVGFISATKEFRQEYARRIRIELEKAEESWAGSEVAVAWDQLYAAPLAYASSNSSDDDFDEYRRPDTPPTRPEQPAEDVIVMALLDAAPALLVRRSKISCVTGIAQRCFEMFALNNVKNALAIDETAELEYRSNFLDRLFERTLSADWLEWTCGELANEVVVRERSSIALSPKHDGVGTISFGKNSTMDVVFLEVVGGVGGFDKVKHRNDTKKVLKAMSLAVHVQHKMVVAHDYADKKEFSALQRIGSFGMVVAGRTLRVYAAKWVDGQVAIDQLSKLSVPSRMEDWAVLGELVRHCLLLRERVGFLAGALKAVGKRNILMIPSPSVILTPTAKRMKRK